MENIELKLANYGLKLPDVLLPKSNVDLHKWAVVACDQFTSEREYWDEITDFVKGSPSTLHITFPEAYLEDPDHDQRIQRIHENMITYTTNVLQPIEPGFILVERDTGKVRYGLMTLIDLENYDFKEGSKTLIRASEQTIVERIPPRKKIRANAPIESPHIMLLIDDNENSVLEPIVAKKENFTKLYEIDLMKNGGKVTGFHICEKDIISKMIEALSSLADPERFKNNYGIDDVLLYAVGDGNHSLATAKDIWEDIKKNDPQNAMTHPGRWALVEIENIYDPGLEFEPIHRALFNVDAKAFFDTINSIIPYDFISYDSIDGLINEVENQSREVHKAGYVDEDKMGLLIFKKPLSTITAGTVQNIIDSFLAKYQQTSVDYIHGDESTLKIGRKKGNCGIFLPKLKKEDFFRTVIMDSALPRKTFSMGEAHEKRYYVECRKIVP